MGHIDKLSFTAIPRLRQPYRLRSAACRAASWQWNCAPAARPPSPDPSPPRAGAAWRSKRSFAVCRRTCGVTAKSDRATPAASASAVMRNCIPRVPRRPRWPRNNASPLPSGRTARYASRACRAVLCKGISRYFRPFPARTMTWLSFPLRTTSETRKSAHSETRRPV